MSKITGNEVQGLMQAYVAVYDPEMRANLEEEQNFVEELSLHMIENAAYVLFSQGYDVDDVISYFTEATENTIIEDFVSYSEGRVLLESVVVSDAYISEQFDILNERFAGVGNVLRGAAGFVGKGLQKAGKFLSNKSVPKAGKQLSLPLGQAAKPNLLQRAATGAKELVKKIPGAKTAANIGKTVAKSPVGRLTGKIGSRVLPGLGVATYGADAVSRAKKGDWGGAALSGLGAAVSAVPGAGTVASLAPAGVQMATDALGLTGDKSKKGPTKPTTPKPTPSQAPNRDQQMLKNLGASQYSAFKGGGGFAALSKGKSLGGVVAQGRKNIGAFDSGPRNVGANRAAQIKGSPVVGPKQPERTITSTRPASSSVPDAPAAPAAKGPTGMPLVGGIERRTPTSAELKAAQEKRAKEKSFASSFTTPISGARKYTAPVFNLKQSFDLYDIIKGHLIDEGYADTEEAAEAIMVSMSEDWRESILEQVTGT